MTKPTQAEVAAALDVIRRAADPNPNLTLAKIAKMSDAELDAAGIDAEQMFRIAAASGADPIPEADR